MKTTDLQGNLPSLRIETVILSQTPHQRGLLFFHQNKDNINNNNHPKDPFKTISNYIVQVRSTTPKLSAPHTTKTNITIPLRDRDRIFSLTAAIDPFKPSKDQTSCLLYHPQEIHNNNQILCPKASHFPWWCPLLSALAWIMRAAIKELKRRSKSRRSQSKEFWMWFTRRNKTRKKNITRSFSRESGNWKKRILN